MQEIERSLSPRGGTTPEALIVRGDQVHCWKFAFVLMVATTIATPVLAIVLVGELANTTEALLDTLIFWGVGALLALCHALWWYFGPGRTNYVCDGKTLKAIRGDRVVKEIDCSTIRALVFISSLTWNNITLTYVVPPISPQLAVTVDGAHGRTRTVYFPKILIWGNGPLDQAHVALAEAVGVPAKPKGWP